MNPELKPETEITASIKDSVLGFVSLSNQSPAKAGASVIAGIRCEENCDRSCFDPCDRGPIGDPCDEGTSCFDPSPQSRPVLPANR